MRRTSSHSRVPAKYAKRHARAVERGKRGYIRETVRKSRGEGRAAYARRTCGVLAARVTWEARLAVSLEVLPMPRWGMRNPPDRDRLGDRTSSSIVPSLNPCDLTRAHAHAQCMRIAYESTAAMAGT